MHKAHSRELLTPKEWFLSLRLAHSIEITIFSQYMFKIAMCLLDKVSTKKPYLKNLTTQHMTTMRLVHNIEDITVRNCQFTAHS